MLGSIGGGRAGGEIALVVHRGGGSGGPDAAGRAFARLDDARVWCHLEQTEVGTSMPSAAAVDAAAVSLAERWDAVLAELPRDWSDLLCLLRIESSALLDRAALLCAPLNPARDGDAVAFTFRAPAARATARRRRWCAGASSASTTRRSSATSRSSASSPTPTTSRRRARSGSSAAQPLTGQSGTARRTRGSWLRDRDGRAHRGGVRVAQVGEHALAEHDLPRLHPDERHGRRP